MTEDWNNNNMFQSIFFKFLMATSFLTFIFCNDEPGTVQTEAQYGSISGKIIHPDNNLLIRVTSDDGVVTAPLNPETHMFTFDSIKAGNCILKVSANGYGLFEMVIVLDKPLYTCHDIVLTKVPPQINTVYPSSSQYLDSLFFNLSSPSNTDSGFWVFINFNEIMDTTSVNNALTILPDTVGIQKEWTPITTSLSLFYPYWRLSTIDTVKVKISRMALDQWGDTLDCDLMLFYPVDANFIRTLLKK